MLLVALGLAGCGDRGIETPKPDAKKAAQALDAGLDAQSHGKLDDAADRYREALKYDNKNKYALYNLALVDAAQSNYGAAEDKYRVVLGTRPGVRARPVQPRHHPQGQG